MTMSRKIYFFGDSFTVDYETDWTWTRQLAEKLHVSNMANNSQPGSSNDWILSQLRDHIKDITPNDVVVLALTSLYRYWFFKDSPELSNFRIGNWDHLAQKHSGIPSEACEAIKGYVNHIQRDDLDQFRFETQVAWLKGVQSSVGFQMLLIPGFDLRIDYNNLTRVHGNMTETVSCAEFVDKKAETEWYRNGIDTRYNHMIRDNHDIMSDKCLNSILTGNDLDLRTGFKRNILRSDERVTHKQIGPKLVELNEKLYGR